MSVLLSEGTSAASALDFTEPFTTALNGISSDFAKYALIAIPIALSIWAGPKVIKIVMKFFNSLTR